MFKINIGFAPLGYKSFVFNGGEVFIKLDYVRDIGNAPVHIVGNIENSNDIMELLMLTDAIKRSYPESKIYLTLPYFPYARQDRVMELGQSLSVKIMADLINAQGYNKVTIYDAHSDVTTALINRGVNIDQSEFVYFFVKENSLEKCILVAPDSGALKKTMKSAQRLGMEIVRADKNRDVKTGEILETVVYSDDVGDKDFLILDDICDGGRTFIELAKVLKTKTTGKVYFYVTHGIFANGLMVFNGVIDGIFCRNLFNSVNHNSMAEYIEAGNIFKYLRG